MHMHMDMYIYIYLFIYYHFHIHFGPQTNLWSSAAPCQGGAVPACPDGVQQGVPAVFVTETVPGKILY